MFDEEKEAGPQDEGLKETTTSSEAESAEVESSGSTEPSDQPTEKKGPQPFGG